MVLNGFIYIGGSTEHIPEMTEVHNLSIMPALFVAVSETLKISNQHRYGPFVCKQSQGDSSRYITKG